MNAQTKVINKLSPFAHFYVKNGNVCIYNALTMDTLK